MLADKTLIVVGAGASSESGLPLGRQLWDQIRSALEYAHSAGIDLRRRDSCLIVSIRTLALGR